VCCLSTPASGNNPATGTCVLSGQACPCIFTPTDSCAAQFDNTQFCCGGFCLPITASCACTTDAACASNAVHNPICCNGRCIPSETECSCTAASNCPSIRPVCCKEFCQTSCQCGSDLDCELENPFCCRYPPSSVSATSGTCVPRTQGEACRCQFNSDCPSDFVCCPGQSPTAPFGLCHDDKTPCACNATNPNARACPTGQFCCASTCVPVGTACTCSSEGACAGLRAALTGVNVQCCNRVCVANPSTDIGCLCTRNPSSCRSSSECCDLVSNTCQDICACTGADTAHVCGTNQNCCAGVCITDVCPIQGLAVACSGQNSSTCGANRVCCNGLCIDLNTQCVCTSNLNCPVIGQGHVQKCCKDICTIPPVGNNVRCPCSSNLDCPIEEPLCCLSTTGGTTKQCFPPGTQCLCNFNGANPDADCPSDFVCCSSSPAVATPTIIGVCFPDDGPCPCSASAHCPAGQTCCRGVCQESSTACACTPTSGCIGTNIVCCNGLCIDSTTTKCACTANTNCPAHFQCCSEVCTPSPTGFQCPCTTNQDCPLEFPQCCTTFNATGSPTTRTCQPASKQCLCQPNSNPNGADGQCPTDSICCPNSPVVAHTPGGTCIPDDEGPCPCTVAPGVNNCPVNQFCCGGLCQSQDTACVCSMTHPDCDSLQTLVGPNDQVLCCNHICVPASQRPSDIGCFCDSSLDCNNGECCDFLTQQCADVCFCPPFTPPTRTDVTTGCTQTPGQTPACCTRVDNSNSLFQCLPCSNSTVAGCTGAGTRGSCPAGSVCCVTPNGNVCFNGFCPCTPQEGNPQDACTQPPTGQLALCCDADNNLCDLPCTCVPTAHPCPSGQKCCPFGEENFCVIGGSCPQCTGTGLTGSPCPQPPVGEANCCKGGVCDDDCPCTSAQACQAVFGSQSDCCPDEEQGGGSVCFIGGCACSRTKPCASPKVCCGNHCIPPNAACPCNRGNGNFLCPNNEICCTRLTARTTPTSASRPLRAALVASPERLRTVQISTLSLASLAAAIPRHTLAFA